jgi:hypothetical protein
LLKVEKALSTWWGIVGVILAIPLASAGAASAVQKLLDRGLESQVQSALSKEDGPVKSTLKKFNVFSGKLSEQFAQNVDSATSKLLRFGCNPVGTAMLDGFPSCVPPKTRDGASGQARDVLEVHDQTLIFKASKGSQRVFLRLRLSPIDSVEALVGVGLRLQSPNILSTDSSGTQHTMVLAKTDLPDTHDFIDPSGLLKLYGGVADLDDQQPLRLDLEITRLLRDKADLHALRFRAEPLPGATPGTHPGAERFYVHAVVIVTHHLPTE